MNGVGSAVTNEPMLLAPDAGKPIVVLVLTQAYVVPTTFNVLANVTAVEPEPTQ